MARGQRHSVDEIQVPEEIKQPPAERANGTVQDAASQGEGAQAGRIEAAASQEEALPSKEEVAVRAEAPAASKEGTAAERDEELERKAADDALIALLLEAQKREAPAPVTAGQLTVPLLRQIYTIVGKVVLALVVGR